MRTLPASPLLKVPPVLRNLPRKTPPLPDAAAVLLPGLRQASALLHVAIRILSDLSGQPPQCKGSAATEALKAKRLLASFGRAPKRA